MEEETNFSLPVQWLLLGLLWVVPSLPLPFPFPFPFPFLFPLPFPSPFPFPFPSPLLFPSLPLSFPLPLPFFLFFLFGLGFFLLLDGGFLSYSPAQSNPEEEDQELLNHLLPQRSDQLYPDPL